MKVFFRWVIQGGDLQLFDDAEFGAAGAGIGCQLSLACHDGLAGYQTGSVFRVGTRCGPFRAVDFRAGHAVKVAFDGAVLQAVEGDDGEATTALEQAEPAFQQGSLQAIQAEIAAFFSERMA